MFVERKKELENLEEQYHYKDSSLVVLYGRRRIGKSALIYHFTEKKNRLLFEGLEQAGEKDQVAHFVSQLADQSPDPLMKKIKVSKWEEAFELINIHLDKQKQKTVIFFDEIQWMSNGKSKLISLIKYFWDNQWKQRNCMLILCGSIASFIINQVIKSKALYGRSNLGMQLSSLTPNEIYLFLRKKRNKAIIFIIPLLQRIFF
ncbi:MAG: AAA family ATPase [Oligoflexia bacterium]|nr:AAA family ATPase [Oligoflexia bacterium]